MAIQKFEPFRDIDRLFEKAASPLLSGMQRAGRDFAVDVYKDDGNLVTEMNVPGIDPDDIDISLENNRLTISGMREEKKETEDDDYVAREIRRGSFRRQIRVPRGITADDVEATYSDGVLTVTVPYEEEVEEPAKKKIEITKEE